MPAVFHVAEVPFWSTLRLKKGDDAFGWGQPMRAFSASLGCTGQGFATALHRADTNMMVGCALLCTFTVRAVRWEIYGGTPEDRRMVALHSSWRWSFGQTLIDGAPLSYDNDQPTEVSEMPVEQLAARLDCKIEQAQLIQETWTELRDANANAALNALGMIRGALFYEKVPVRLPAHTCFSLEWRPSTPLIDYRLSKDVYVRFYLHGTSALELPDMPSDLEEALGMGFGLEEEMAHHEE